MCGIALILSEANVLGPALSGLPQAHGAEDVHQPFLSIADLKAALIRRGPDKLGSKKVFLQLGSTNAVKDDEILSHLNVEATNHASATDCHLQSLCSSPQIQIGSSISNTTMIRFDAEQGMKKGLCLCGAGKEKDFVTSAFEAACAHSVVDTGLRSVVELHFLGATLQLRGISPVSQPLVDASGNILVYNGEIFGGIHVDSDKNDGETLLHVLERSSCYCHKHERACCFAEKGEYTVPVVLSSIRGPWALIYWQAKSKTIWFGRDAFGRRSLLVHWPTSDDPRFVLSSVSPHSSFRENSGATFTNNNFKSDGDFEDSKSNMVHASYWDELVCGIYSICLEASKVDTKGIIQNFVGEVKRHEWTEPLLEKLIKWERRFVDPKVDEFYLHSPSVQREHVLPSTYPEGYHSCVDDLGDCVINQMKIHTGDLQPAHKVLIALRESVMRRTTLSTELQTTFCQGREEELVPVALLFSGGLDSMILAALVDKCLNVRYAIDLLNVSFDGQLAPDRISARAGLEELQKIAPCRRWQLVEIDADFFNLASETKHLMSLINPAKTYMDLNIGIALWLAASGEGFVDGKICSHDQHSHRYKYKSSARILLVGSGADEQCAGYGRHKTKYRLGGWVALQEEMKLDMQRIWKRNLGRDDRCISDHGKEARFPFLDEDVIRALLEIPLWEIAKLDEPVGRGDKKILREVARLLGIEGASVLPKRAIQFGSRIARESNRKNFRSNRAANQASAGSVVIYEPC